jgi:hypothetical protein
MTHPLTDEIIDTQDWGFSSPEFDEECDMTFYDKDDMRAAADWQLEQVIKWLKDYTKSVEFRYHPQYVATRLKKEMRPTTQKDN